MEATQLELFPREEQQPEQPAIRFEQAEWCFQFFDNEPVVFAWAEDQNESGDLILTINPTDSSAITFTDKGMSFKLFARPMTEETKALREQRRVQNNQ